MKSQTPNTKLQTNLKFQYSMTKTQDMFVPPKADPWSVFTEIKRRAKCQLAADSGQQAAKKIYLQNHCSLLRAERYQLMRQAKSA